MKALAFVIMAVLSTAAAAESTQMSQKDVCKTVATKFSKSPFSLSIDELKTFENCTAVSLNKAVSASPVRSTLPTTAVSTN